MNNKWFKLSLVSLVGIIVSVISLSVLPLFSGLTNQFSNTQHNGMPMMTNQQNVPQHNMQNDYWGFSGNQNQMNMMQNQMNQMNQFRQQMFNNMNNNMNNMNNNMNNMNNNMNNMNNNMSNMPMM